MPPSFCGFPHTVLRRGRVACLALAFAGVLPFVPCLVQRENADGEQLALIWQWVAGKLHMVVQYSESDTATPTSRLKQAFSATRRGVLEGREKV